MGLDMVSAGRDVPNEINVVIEIPKDAEPSNTRWTRKAARFSWIAFSPPPCATPATTATCRAPWAAMATRSTHW